MRSSLSVAALALCVGLAQGWVAPQAAVAEEPEQIEGEVTKVDRDRHRVTVRSRDGGQHEFEASDETLQELKVGDRIEAKRRPKPGEREQR